MHPHPVHIPTGSLRELRRLLTQRGEVLKDRVRGQLRAASRLRSCGQMVNRSSAQLRRAIGELVTGPDGVDTSTYNYLEMCLWYIERHDRDVAELDQGVSLFITARTRVEPYRLAWARPPYFVQHHGEPGA